MSDALERTVNRNATWNQAISAAADSIAKQIASAGRHPIKLALEQAYEAVKALKR